MPFKADDVWDIDDLIPKKKKSGKPRYSFDTETVELSFGSDGERLSEAIPPEPLEPPVQDVKSGDRLGAARAAMRSAELKYAERDAGRRIEKTVSKETGHAGRPQPEPYRPDAGVADVPPEPPAFTYVPDNPFIKSVSVLPWPTRFAFRERFCEDARKLFPAVSREAAFADFVSYSPGYNQLSSAQRAYYVSWREGIRRGEYLKTTASYITLFVAETVNLPELVPPETGIAYLCGIYMNYASRFEIVKRELPRWILDYCLINRVKPAEGFRLIDSFRTDGELATVLGGFGGGSEPVVSAVAASSSHSYTESRVLTEENTATFAKHVPAAVRYTVRRAMETGERPFSPGDRPWSSVRESERPSYSGLVCSYGSKRVIRTETLSVLRSPELCHAVGDITKYAENRVRAMLGIKNRYHITQLTLGLKKIIDDYFSIYTAEISKAAPVPEYEKYYDADESELSAERAAEIENAGWLTTGLLTEDDGVEPEEPAPAVTDESVKTSPEPGDIAALSAALEGAASFAAAAKKLGVFPEALADRVNNAFFDEFGDNVVDAIEDGFAVTFYTDEVRAFVGSAGAQRTEITEN